jgi:hypothetical protein
MIELFIENVAARWTATRDADIRQRSSAPQDKMTVNVAVHILKWTNL